MRLLIDEQYSPEIARQLRDRDHDVVSVHDVREGDTALEGFLDEPLFEVAAEDRRAIVTENVADFLPVQQQAVMTGQTSYGVVCLSRTKFPRSKNTIGLTVDALDEYLSANRDDDALAKQGSVHWL